MARETALGRSARVEIETPTLHGSISLKGARIDDLALVHFHKTVDPHSPEIILFSPPRSAAPYYAEFGWTDSTGTTIAVPGPETEWKQDGNGALGVDHPVTLNWNNGNGVVFRRTFSIDHNYLFTVEDRIENRTARSITLDPYGEILRQAPARPSSSYLLYEGPTGVLGKQGLQHISYKELDKRKLLKFDDTDVWLGFTDKYWASALLPDPNAHLEAGFSAQATDDPNSYQVTYLLDPQTIRPGDTGHDARLFAGPKVVSIIDHYNRDLHLDHFDLMIDWGWFSFLTKPMFAVIDSIFQVVGNFGLAILLVTVAIKIIFFPLARKSYVAMAKMKALQPQVQAIRDRYSNDKAMQQQTLMELYRKEKVNPATGCLPMLLQAPVFFSLYKVLFITIEMRHAPFFGWIQDLSAPDPTNMFNLFGLLPFNPEGLPLIGSHLQVGVWPLVMGVTMWLQMRLNPQSADPNQKLIFNWMPVVFTFMLAKFPAGLVIYWAWNNLLSVIQQIVIMNRHGTKVELLDNLRLRLVRRWKQG